MDTLSQRHSIHAVEPIKRKWSHFNTARAVRVSRIHYDAIRDRWTAAPMEFRNFIEKSTALPRLPNE